MKRADLHFYDPLYEILLFGDMPSMPGGLRSRIRAGSDQIELKKHIMPFIRCPEVARLHWLNQAGFIHLVYPSGSHSRFAHALGTLHLGSIALHSISITHKNITRNLNGWLKISDWIEEFIIALFLHDLGHYPFSHTLENNYGLKKILGNEFVKHEEAACQLIKGEGIIYEAYKKRYKDEQEQLVSSIFKELSGYQKEIVCHLISGEKHSRSANHNWLLEMIHDLVSGTYDLDRIDHYRRDSFFTGLGHTFKPYVLLYGLHYKFNSASNRIEEYPDKDAESQISTLLFIRDQLHKYCFGNILNISFNAMLNNALSLHLIGLLKRGAREKALSILTMTDGELLAYLLEDRRSYEIIKDLRSARAYPCIATFPKEGNLDSSEILEKVFEQDNSIILGFSKYFDTPEKPWLGKTDKVPDTGKGYVFSKNQNSDKIIKKLAKIGINGLAFPTKDEINSFNYISK